MNVIPNRVKSERPKIPLSPARPSQITPTPLPGRRLDGLTFVGLAVAFGAVGWGQQFDGGELAQLFNLPALIVVLGGTVGAMLLQVSWSTLWWTLKRLSWLWFPPTFSHEATFERLLQWSQIARSEGLIGLENLIDDERDPFAKRALQLLAQGCEPDDVRYALEIYLNNRELQEMRAVQVLESMGGYAPTISLIGAVLGLIQAMNKMDGGRAELGAGIAAAFVATIYGVGLANMVCIPMANKLKSLIQRQSLRDEMVIEGALAIAQNDNPRHVAIKLQGFLP